MPRRTGIPIGVRVVYFALCEKRQRIKIGTTAQLDLRLPSLRSDEGAPVKLLRALPGSYRQERWVHRRFAHLRPSITEWFTVAPELLAFIESMASLPTDEEIEREKQERIARQLAEWRVRHPLGPIMGRGRAATLADHG
jgi:hypothetical protein